MMYRTLWQEKWFAPTPEGFHDLVSLLVSLYAVTHSPSVNAGDLLLSKFGKNS